MGFIKNQPDYNGISIILPAFNEEANIKHAVEAISEYLAGLKIGFEIIVVDDGSRDNTSGIVEGLAAGNAMVRLIKHPENQGYGYCKGR